MVRKFLHEFGTPFCQHISLGNWKTK